jgi:PAS domain S-box-containing protein
MIRRFPSMTFGLAVGVTAAVVIACASGAYLYSRHHFEAQLEMARTTALSKGELIRVALEHQMIENDRSLIGRMIEGFGKQPRVDRVALLDRAGKERYASGPPESEAALGLDSATCQACHRLPPDQRGSSRVIETKGGTLLRTVVPIRNRAECHACHDARHEINGILILDYNAGEIREALSRDVRAMAAWTGAVALLLVTALALIIRYFVLRRLQRFETTARRIAAGDLEQRVPAEGSDTLAWLAREFNTMADSVTGLVGEVRSQRERLENVINSIDDGIVVLDEGRRIVAANQAFLRRTGQERDRVLGYCCQQAGPAMCQVDDCPALACLRSGQSQVRIVERRTPEGAGAWEEVHSSPVLDPAGKLLHVVEVWRDISDRRAAEAQLAESHRLASLGTLASGFSHELNTPLATILTCVEGILRESARENAGSRIAENAAIAREQVLRCRGITQHFLRISRGQRSEGDIVDVRAAVAAVERLIEPTARGHAVKVEMDTGGPAVLVRADEAELQHTLINLMLNAVQASSQGGRVTVRVESGDPVRIRVSDEGCGIPPEFKQKIFEPFFSLRKGGTGLGLFLSLNFVRRWGGDIAVQSAPGAGSTFEITLPALKPAALRVAAS